MLYWTWMVEGFFYADLLLSFFQEFRDNDKNIVIRDFWVISMNYLKGWFIIDFLACFPFNIIFSAGLMLKLVRLARLPRLIKLLDESKFKKTMRAVDGPTPSIE